MRHRLRIITLIAALAALVPLMVACGDTLAADEGEPERDETPVQGETAVPDETTVTTDPGGPLARDPGIPGSGDDGARPPDGTVEAGGDAIPLGLGSYCWSDGQGLCVDMIGPITADAVLEVDRGETVALGGALAQALAQADEVLVEAWERPAAPLDRGDYGVAWQLASDAVTLHDADGAFTIDLPPGDYLVSIFVSFPEGSASYGAQVTVR